LSESAEVRLTNFVSENFSLSTGVSSNASACRSLSSMKVTSIGERR
jgi:hypothetical protein